jgi:hypothetical protein
MIIDNFSCISPLLLDGLKLSSRPAQEVQVYGT